MKRETNRRTFLRGGAAALAASAMNAAEGSEIRTVSIGVGRRGGALLNRVLRHPNVKVTAICDIDATARDQAQSTAQRDNPRSFSDYREVLDLQDVDAVFIATPCDSHAKIAAAALQAGKYVYCEKPLGITPGEIDHVLRAAERSRAFLQIGQQRRYSPAEREIVSYLHEKKILGRPFVIKAQRHSTPAKPSEQTAEGSGERRRRPAWYDDVRRSGDLIVENAIHNLDVCNWFAGSRPVSAFGHGKRYLPEPIPAGTIMMDGFSVEYVYENDMHLDYSQLYLHPRSLRALPNAQWWVIFGEKGAIHLGRGGWTFHEMYGDQEPREFRSEERMDSTLEAQKDFFACIRENRKPFADVKVAAVAALTSILGREAIYRRRMVTWDELGVSV